ncbi:MAG: class E sortase [Actinobacteria bacterium]|nr:class E sortase [Actinomycetota bacterium]
MPGADGSRWTTFARVLHSVGRLLITSGTVILLFVGYELWGTNLQTNRSQTDLRRDFRRALARTKVDDGGVVDGSGRTTTTRPPGTGSGSTPSTTPPSTAPGIPPPGEGQPLGQISMPSIGVRNFAIVQGVSIPVLKRGAGHYPETPLPGQAGNAAIAGHRTTYGAPFHNVDKLRPGDSITVRTLQGLFTYKVFATKIVLPNEVWVLQDFGDNRLTLTACEPKFSAKQRIIIMAKLVGNPVPKLPGQDAAARKIARAGSEAAAGRTAIDQYQAEGVVRFPGALWGLATVGVWALVRLGAWGLRRRRFVRVLPYAAGLPVCMVLLYLFFENFSYEAFTAAIRLNL